jgi:hypothetical protein
MWRSPQEIGNDKSCGQNQDNTGATRYESAMDESCNKKTVCDKSERECRNEDGAVILTRQCDGLKDECQNHQWYSYSEQPTDALRSMHGV